MHVQANVVVPDVVDAVQLCPKLEEYHKAPVVTHATAFCPEAEMATQDQANELALDVSHVCP